MITNEQRDFLFPLAYNAAIRAGKTILDIYEKRGFDFDVKEDKSPITLADTAAHELIKDYLGQSHIPILSEEGREMRYEERMNWDLFWMVDPLDGTKEFLNENGEFTVNIALMMNNRAVLSVVYVPCVDRIYFADDNCGAFMKGNVIAAHDADFNMEQIMSDVKSLPSKSIINNPMKVLVSRSHNTDATFEMIGLFKNKHIDNEFEIIEQGSSYKFCLIADGECDYYVRTSGTYEWDTAAGEHILTMAGGSVLPLHGGIPMTYNKQSLQNPNFECRSKHLVAKEMVN